MPKPWVIVAEGGRSRKPDTPVGRRVGVEALSKGVSGVPAIQRSLISFGTTILNELNNKRGDGDEQHYVDQATLVQQEFQDEPDGYQN